MNNNIEKEFSLIREESMEGMEVARGTPYNSNADSNADRKVGVPMVLNADMDQLMESGRVRDAPPDRRDGRLSVKLEGCHSDQPVHGVGR